MDGWMDGWMEGKTNKLTQHVAKFTSSTWLLLSRELNSWILISSHSSSLFFSCPGSCSEKLWSKSEWRKEVLLFNKDFPFSLLKHRMGMRQQSKFVLKKSFLGLPWWRSGSESSCQCRGHGFEPWSGKIPHAAEQLSPWATTTAARVPRAYAPQQEKPPQWEARAPQWRPNPAKTK